MKELVTTFKKNAAVNSKDVATHFKKTHAHLVETVRNLVSENSETKTMFFETFYEYRGKKFPMYWMNRDGFSLLVMGFTGKKALEWKLKYIAAFNAMERQLAERQTAEWQEARAKGKLARRGFTDEIQRFAALAEAQGHHGTAKHAYPNLTKLVKRPLGTRQEASTRRLAVISTMEELLGATLAPMVDAGMDAKDIYPVMKQKAAAFAGMMAPALAKEGTR